MQDHGSQAGGNESGLMKAILASILCLTVSASFIVRSPSALGLTLQEAREEALKTYWGVKIAHEEVIAAQSEWKGRFADFFPKITFNGNGTRYDKPSEFMLSQGQISGTFFKFPTEDTLIPITNRDIYQFDSSLQ
jgi:hypothetical protein